ncbi:MAG: branched-chain amino acid ABC transporter permease, partial [Pseudomonadota bacterium]|nr:branched-chain amino acid ABC transporter permease [Pseudomonadota bacterium]
MTADRHPTAAALPAEAANAPAAASDESAAVAAARFDFVPLALVAVLVLGAWPLVGSTSTWLTLTVAGLAAGMIVFIIASGLTLVFGLMDVLNFGHGVFIAFGAYLAVTVFAGLAEWSSVADVARNLVVIVAALLAAAAVAAAIGVVFERLLVRPAYGQHLKQILITMGGMIVGEELIKV